MDEYKQICLEYYQRRADELQQRWMITIMKLRLAEAYGMKIQQLNLKAHHLMMIYASQPLNMVLILKSMVFTFMWWRNNG